MRTDLNSGGFTLYEILFSNTIVELKPACFPFPVLTAGPFCVSKHCGSVQRHYTAGAFTGAKLAEISPTEKRIPETPFATKKQRQL